VRPEEILAAAYSDHDGGVWRTGGADQGVRDRAAHLYAVLVGAMRILGISAFYHDSAAALIDDGRIVAAAQEERIGGLLSSSDLEPRIESRISPTA
jgi:hypothetical protein